MKRILKKVVIAIFYVFTLPFGITAKLTYKIFGSQILFAMFGELLSLIPSFFGYFIRGCYYQMTLTKADVSLYVAFGSYISKIETKIGKNVGIGGKSIVGLCEIGDYTVIANNVSILSGSKQHNFDNLDASITATENNFERMIIGDNVFIGDQSVIMAHIGCKSIIGAGSIVVKDIPAFSIAVGNPAKVIKKRS